MSKKKIILSQAGKYSFATQLAQAITLIASLASRRFLGPMQTGIWSTLQILVDYSKYSVLGLMDAVGREIPYQMGKGNEGRAYKLKNLAFSFIVCSSSVIAIGIACFAFLMRRKYSPELTFGLYAVAAIIFLQRLNNLMIALLRSFKKFEIESILMIASAVVNGILVAGLSYYYKIYGFVLAMALSFVFNIGFVLWRYPFDFRFDLDSKELKPLISFGFPLMLLGILVTILRSLDKIVIAKWMGFQAMGYYSIAIMVTSYISNYAISIAIVLLPYFQEKFGEKNNPEDLWRALIKSTRAYALTVPLMIVAAWIAAPWVVHAVLPKFVPGIPAMKILCLSMFFIALNQPFYDFLITLKKHWLLFPTLIFSIVLAAFLNYRMVQTGQGIEGIASATALVSFITFSLNYFVTSKQIRVSEPKIKPFLFILGCFAYLVITSWIITKLLLPNDFSFRSLLYRALCVIIVYVPFVLVIRKDFFVHPKPAPVIPKNVSSSEDGRII